MIGSACALAVGSGWGVWTDMNQEAAEQRYDNLLLLAAVGRRKLMRPPLSAWAAL